MNKFSIKRLRAERNLRRIEKELKQEPVNSKCFFYPVEKRSCFHHIVNKSEGLKWIDRENNLLPIGHTAHKILHRGYNTDIICLPRFPDYLLKMKKLNEDYYNRYMLKLSK